MRAFIGVKIPESLAEELWQLNRVLMSENYKPVEAHNMHLTLKFLGEVSFERYELLRKKVERKIKGLNKFEFTLKGVGAFPSAAAARVVWVGVDKGSENLKKLAALVEEAAVESGFPQEQRKFEPHLTLGRLRRQRSLVNKLKRIEGLLGGREYRVSVSKIIFFKSTLTPAGPVYEEVFSVELG